MQNNVDLKNKYNYHKATPMMKQYLDAKIANPECLVLFRMGDFYELFYDDAITASKILGIALAKRGKTENQDIPMCGVPHHSLESYLFKLLENKYKIAICEQLETPEEAKKRGNKEVVRREVVKIITPGTVTEDSILNDSVPNYLISVVIDKNKSSISKCDINTGELSVYTIPKENIPDELARIKPKEIIISEKIQFNLDIYNLFNNYKTQLTFQVESYFKIDKCINIIKNYYNINVIDSIGSLNEPEISSIGGLIEYLKVTQKSSMPHLPYPKIIKYDDFMLIDESTLKNLEITSTMSGKYKGSLLDTINHTKTKAGSRLLYKYISSPLRKANQINQRLETTEFFYKIPKVNDEIREIISLTYDIEKSLSKILMGKGSPKDLLQIKETIKKADIIKNIISNSEINIPEIINKIISNFSDFYEIVSLIDNSIEEDCPNSISDGGYIKESYNKDVAKFRNMLTSSTLYIDQLQNKYREETKVDNLKISKNNMIGYYVEVTSRNEDKIDKTLFIQRQSLNNYKRYTRPELQKLEEEIATSKSMLIEVELSIFNEITKILAENIEKLMKLAHNLAVIDVFNCFAWISREYNYIRPEITDDNSFCIKQARHASIEYSLKNTHQSFVANNCDLSENNRLWLITGPNMAGKSTFLRQNALLAIISHAGCFIPASHAKIGTVDKLFSRIGATDDLSKGQSTFMVEMVETSSILAQATEKSLIILDEVGRGTSTYDGISIAWSCLEYIHNILKCRCLFATHYHELISLEKDLTCLANYSAAIDDQKDKITFLYEMIQGGASQSYGIHVAELAGLPKKVIERSKEILSNLESSENNKDNSKKIIHASSNNEEKPITKESTKHDEIFDLISSINPDNLTPKEALELMYKIQSKISNI